MKEYPILSTERLRLDKVVWTDIPAMIEYAGDRAIYDATGTIPHPFTEENAVWSINNALQCFEDGSGYFFAIRRLIDQIFIGRLSLRINLRHNRAEIGYWLGRPFWGKGYATEAVRRLLEFAFMEVKLNKVSAFHLVNNSGSKNVMIKNGMIKEGVHIDHIKKEFLYYTVGQYGITREKYLSLQV